MRQKKFSSQGGPVSCRKDTGMLPNKKVGKEIFVKKIMAMLATVQVSWLPRLLQKRPDLSQSADNPSGTRAQPLKRILFLRLLIHFADFPCPHCSIDQRLFTLERCNRAETTYELPEIDSEKTRNRLEVNRVELELELLKYLNEPTSSVELLGLTGS